jgi:hypothetical protein
LVEIGKNTEKVGALHPSDGTEDAHTNKQLKRKMEFMIGPRTPEALIRCKPGGRLQSDQQPDSRVVTSCHLHFLCFVDHGSQKSGRTDAEQTVLSFCLVVFTVVGWVW